MGAGITVVFSLIGEPFHWIETGPLAQVTRWKIGFDPILFQAYYVGNSAILGIAEAIWGCKCQRKRTHRAKSSIGVLSIIEAGVTKVAKMIRALPPSTT